MMNHPRSFPLINPHASASANHIQPWRMMAPVEDGGEAVGSLEGGFAAGGFGFHAAPTVADAGTIPRAIGVSGRARPMSIAPAILQRKTPPATPGPTKSDLANR